jgi:demethylmenaquinone methyltransferase/2-methoxy-6-polyprenyl-1,4-benzoquinol methylase
VPDELVDYYEARAPYYDEAHAGPTPAWVDEMVAAMLATLAGRHVLEVACGTGQWTRRLAGAASTVTAVDAAPSMLAIAAATVAGHPNVTLRQGNAYRLADIEGTFDGALAMQWWSHVPYARRGEFLAQWHARLAPGAAVFLGDNQLTPPWDERLVRRPGDADTYEPRTLPDGSSYVIVKNYFTAAELRATFAPHAAGDVHVTMGTRWWWLAYRLP